MIRIFSRLLDWLRDNRWALCVLAITWLIFFSPILSGRSVYFLDDLKILYYPLEHAYAQAQHEWRLPQWSNEFGFGHPILAWGQLGFFTPLHVLLRALYVPPLTLLQISVPSYFGLGLLGMYVFLRRFVSKSAAALGSIVYVFSGFNIGHLNHVNFYTTTMVLPWLLVCIYRFIHVPRIRSAVIVSLVGAMMALSGQPQVILYSFTIATIVALAFLVGRTRSFIGHWRQLGRLGALGVLAILLALSLASFAILPLYEFLPQTERVGGLPEIELFEFSYPPYHAITLVLPYFFGDHEHYWGPKGFQELAAFIGIVPLFLGCIALSWWRNRRALRAAASIMFIISVALALGRNSVVYSWLVEHKLITSLSVPGRFVFFFDAAFAILAALGLDDLFRLHQLSPRQRAVIILTAFVLPSIIFAGFFWQIQSDARVYSTFVTIVSTWQPQWVLLVFGIAVCIGMLLAAPRFGDSPRLTTLARGSLLLLCAATLLTMSWNYNPRLARDLAQVASPFASALEGYRTEAGLPPRLYSADNILSSIPPVYDLLATEHISPKFTVHQRITIAKPGLSCISVPIHTNDRYHAPLHVSLRTNITDPPLETVSFAPYQLSASEPLEICSPKFFSNPGQAFFISFESQSPSPVQLLYTTYHQEEEPAYFVRVANPTRAQIEASRKNARIVFDTTYAPNADRDVAIIHRHLNVIAGASSAKWIGALSIGNYRAFIEHFFANDREPIDGDGIHAIVRGRKVLDMAGVTHLVQMLPHGADDGVLATGYSLVETYDFGPKEVRLYENPQVLPKAFLVSNAIFKPAADETRYALHYEPYDARAIVYIDGPVPPALPAQPVTHPPSGTASIITYRPLRVDVEVNTPEEVFLVVSDSTTAQWRTFIDDRPVNQYRANSIFKAAQVPPGKHLVSFRYYSPAIARSKQLTLGGLAAVALLWLFPYFHRRTNVWLASR